MELEDLRSWIINGFSPEDRTAMQVEYGMEDDVLDGLELLVKDNYPVENSIKLVTAMKKRALVSDNPVLDQVKHLIKLRAVLK